MFDCLKFYGKYDKTQNNKFARFRSVADFADAAFLAVNASGCAKTYESGTPRKWAGGTVEDCARFCRCGDVSAVAEASAFADRINDSVDIAGAVDTWGLDVAGAFPCVPAYLAGDVDNMWSRADDSSSRGVLDVYFDLGVSCSVDQKKMRRRGVCVLAVLLALQRVRRVRAHLYTAERIGNFIMDFSYPFDVSEIAAFCGKTCITRIYSYSFAVLCGDNSVGWSSWAMGQTGSEATEKDALVEFAGIDEGSLVLPSGVIGDLADYDDTRFVEYLNGLIASVNGRAAA